LVIYLNYIKLLSLSQYSPAYLSTLPSSPVSSYVLPSFYVTSFLTCCFLVSTYIITSCSLQSLLPQSHAHPPPGATSSYSRRSENPVTHSGINVSYILEEMPEYNQSVCRRKGGNPTNRSTSRQTGNLS